MKKGSKFKVQVEVGEGESREFEVEWQGKAKALKWARKAQHIQLEDHRELYELQKQYPPEVAPELHERDEDGNPTVAAPGAPERQHELCMAVLGPAYGEDAAEQLFDEDPVLCFQLALAVMNAHRLDAKVPLS